MLLLVDTAGCPGVLGVACNNPSTTLSADRAAGAGRRSADVRLPLVLAAPWPHWQTAACKGLWTMGGRHPWSGIHGQAAVGGHLAWR